MTNQKIRKPLNKYIVFSTMVFQMGITIAAGAYFGMWLDQKYPNNYSLYTMIFSLLGVFGSLYMVIKKVININKEKNRDSN